ncbi:carbonic anhydrase 14 isoform X1 [Pelobates cultripes]|uniref:Carbonic anhydrase n=1 Tax=Pelobates cultripes TaxID=61616 RepID=A0AAD1TM39_PELCU|nr:carbonic anhydrase 14 isoform X1 [Pelobates cultripes]
MLKAHYKTFGGGGGKLDQNFPLAQSQISVSPLQRLSRKILQESYPSFDTGTAEDMSFHSTCWVHRILQCSILILTACQIMVESSSWTYTGHEGQEHWKEAYPDCGGTAQSPVNIQTANVSYDDSLQPIEPIGYSTPGTGSFTLRNNGHTVVLMLSPSMHLRGLSHNFTAVQLHLHWGSSSHPFGSEHQIDSKAFPAEMHIVHYNSDKYADINEAKNKPDGLAVLGIFMEVMQSGATDNLAYGNIFNYLENVSYADQSVTVPAFNVHNLLPNNLDHYFRYRGSLTTPPCHQSVLWTVFHERVHISRSQLDKLQTVVFSTKVTTPSSPLQNNVRDPQPLNQRIVNSSFLVPPPGSYTTGQILGIFFGTFLALLGTFCIVYFVYKKYRKNRMEVGGKASNVAHNSPSTTAEHVEVKSFQF